VIEPFVIVNAGDVGLDYAGWRPHAAELHMLGVSFVSRYMCRMTHINKWIFKPEVEMLHANGIGLVLNWEQSGTEWLQGGPAGQQDGFSAAQYALSLGAPPGTILVFSYDTNVPAGSVAAKEYGYAAYSECAKAGFEFGVYGDLDVIRLVRGISSLNWLAGANSWSDSTRPYEPEKQPNYDLVHVRQYIAGSANGYDRNVVLKPFKVWLPHEVADPVDPVEPVTVDDPAPPEVINDITPLPPVDLPAIVPEEDEVQYIIDTPGMGSVLLTVVRRDDNSGSYVLSGINDPDTREVLVEAGLKVVNWSDSKLAARIASGH
jgi:hypothetical protein